MEFEEITGKIIGAAYAVYNTMGYGYLESVYERCLEIEFRKLGLEAQFQQPLAVYYEDQVVGNFVADVFVEDIVVVEIKSVTRINPAHELQVVNYLTATQKPVGLVINFSPTQVEIKRKVPSL